MVHEHGHPHVLLLQVANAFYKLCVPPPLFPPAATEALYSPGDYLKPGETDTEGLQARLDMRLGPAGMASESELKVEDGLQMDGSAVGEWQIEDSLAQWWRPNFEGFMVRLFARVVLLARAS